METIERKIYNGYAFTENEREKAKINYEIYKELNGKYITHHHMIDYYIDMNNFKDWFDMTVENCLITPYGYDDNGIKRGLVDIYVKAEVKNEN